MARPRDTPEMFARAFWAKVEKIDDGCWIWRGSVDGKGYGVLGRRYWSPRTKRAHRVAWELANGPIQEGMSALHRCDRPLCVNPSHLFLGTQADNIADMMRKGRHGKTTARGERCHSKLTEVQVREMRRLASMGMTKTAIGKLFGVTDVQVCNIVNRKQWKHV